MVYGRATWTTGQRLAIAGSQPVDRNEHGPRRQSAVAFHNSIATVVGSLYCLTCQICPDISRYSKSLIITCVILSYISVYVLYHARGFTSDFPRTALGTTSPMLLARPARALRQLRHGDLPCDQMDDGV